MKHDNESDSIDKNEENSNPVQDKESPILNRDGTELKIFLASLLFPLLPPLGILLNGLAIIISIDSIKYKKDKKAWLILTLASIAFIAYVLFTISIFLKMSGLRTLG